MSTNGEGTHRVIWKYPLNETSQEIEMPAHAEILTGQFQAGVPTLWALVNPREKEMEKRRIVIVPTGESHNFSSWEYINTDQINSPMGILVFHFFERL